MRCVITCTDALRNEVGIHKITKGGNECSVSTGVRDFRKLMYKTHIGVYNNYYKELSDAIINLSMPCVTQQIIVRAEDYDVYADDKLVAVRSPSEPGFITTS